MNHHPPPIPRPSSRPIPAPPLVSPSPPSHPACPLISPPHCTVIYHSPNYVPNVCRPLKETSAVPRPQPTPLPVPLVPLAPTHPIFIPPMSSKPALFDSYPNIFIFFTYSPFLYPLPCHLYAPSLIPRLIVPPPWGPAPHSAGCAHPNNIDPLLCQRCHPHCVAVPARPPHPLNTNSLADMLIGTDGEFAAPAVVTAVVTGIAAVAAACDAAMVVTPAWVVVASSCAATVVVGAAVSALLMISAIQTAVALADVVVFPHGVRCGITLRGVMLSSLSPAVLPTSALCQRLCPLPFYARLENLD